MSAMEKACWAELLVSVTTVIVVGCLYPWFGDTAAAGFGLMGLIGLCALFVRQRGQRVVVDERDQAIDKKAIHIAIKTAWILLLMTVLAISIWSIDANKRVVPFGLLMWAIWFDSALLYIAKGLVGVIEYRRQRYQGDRRAA